MSTTTKNDWIEKLPPKCPPKSAIKPNEFQCYRLMSSHKPSDKDFYSHRKLHPHKTYRTNECRTHSLSVFTNHAELSKIGKLPTQRSKVIVKLILMSASGLVEKTGKNKSHYSWWLKKNYLTNTIIEMA